MASVLLSEGIAQCNEDGDEYCGLLFISYHSETQEWNLSIEDRKLTLLGLDRQQVNVFSRDTGLRRFDISIK